jgi:cytochrome c-type biogenesis protein CcmH/NrfG
MKRVLLAVAICMVSISPTLAYQEESSLDRYMETERQIVEDRQHREQMQQQERHHREQMEQQERRDQQRQDSQFIRDLNRM